MSAQELRYDCEPASPETGDTTQTTRPALAILERSRAARRERSRAAIRIGETASLRALKPVAPIRPPALLSRSLSAPELPARAARRPAPQLRALPPVVTLRPHAPHRPGFWLNAAGSGHRSVASLDTCVLWVGAAGGRCLAMGRRCGLRRLRHLVRPVRPHLARPRLPRRRPMNPPSPGHRR